MILFLSSRSELRVCEVISILQYGLKSKVVLVQVG